MHGLIKKMSLLEARLKDILSQALQDAFRSLQSLIEPPLSGDKISPVKKQSRSTKDQEELLMNLSRTCVLLDKVALIANHFRDVIVDPFVQRVLPLFVYPSRNYSLSHQLCRPLPPRALKRPQT
jgi:hypothetical protein